MVRGPAQGKQRHAAQPPANTCHDQGPRALSPASPGGMGSRRSYSLREITRHQVTAALPAGGSPRALLGQALRSLFTVLKGRKMVFANPLSRIRTGRPDDNEPLPLDNLAILRQALGSDDPFRAALAALIGFHGLRSHELRGLYLTSIRDGRLHIGDRTILLAGPVRARVTAWLDYRARRWPRTQNPHLLVNAYTAVRLGQVSAHYLTGTLGASPQAVREDRILHEAQASSGDLRRVMDMFGLSVKGASRYTDTLGHPDLHNAT